MTAPSTLSTTVVSSPRIAIIGGGPSGLTLLLTLARRGVTATLYEREPGRDSRAHLGGMLDLEWDSGQRALRENGLEDAFKASSRRDAEETKICGKDGIPLFYRPGGDATDGDLEKARPEIDRRVLRQVLVDAVPEGAIKWGHALTGIRPLSDGQHQLTFANGAVVVADIVVGADGANSRIRPLLSPATPVYHGVTGAEISLAPAVAALPENADIVQGMGVGSCYAAEDNKMICFQRNGDGRVRMYAWHRAPLDWELPGAPAEAKKVLLSLYESWAPWMRKAIAVADESAIYPRPLFHLPVDHRWEHASGITLIGDAGHLMSPFAGAGANLAMRDGLELGLILSEAVKQGWDAEEREKAIAAWENETFERVGRFAALTLRNLETVFSSEAPRAMVSAFEASVSQK
ncbi:monooxygenase FAD-binding protein [Trametes elegans]|nr:monooxygenase FAD-binding protein [Trametes elegans]